MTVQDEVRQRIERDVLLAKLRKKIDSGKADFNDTFLYSDRAGKLLGDIFAQRLPDIPIAEREALCVDLLHDRYTDINSLCDAVQRALDKANGLHLKPQRAPFEEARAHLIGHSTADQTVSVETQQRRGRSATATMTRSMHDDRMKAEAKFRSGAGLQCYITRKTDGKCCAWCSAMAGRYEYYSEPKDVYRRHDNCGCSVTYENGRKRQDVWSKREWEAPEPGAGAGDPVVLTKEQARNAGADQPIRFSKAERMAAVGADLIQAEPIEHSVEEKLELARFARSLGFDFHNAMSFDGDSALLMEQLKIMASLRDEFHIPRRIVLYVKNLGEDLGVTYYRKTIMINSSALRSDAITSAYLSADHKLSSTKTIGIGVHEIGHLIAEKYGEIGLDIAQKACYNINGEKLNYYQVLDYLLQNISSYSITRNPDAISDRFKPTHYHEIIPEVLGKHFTDPDAFTTEFFKLLKEACNI